LLHFDIKLTRVTHKKLSDDLLDLLNSIRDPEEKAPQLKPDKVYAAVDYHSVEAWVNPPVAVTLEQAQEFVLISDLRKQSLKQLVTELPPPDKALFVLANGIGAEPIGERGAFDFGAFLPVLVDMVCPGGGATAHVSTWTLNRRAAWNMVDMLASGKLAHLVLATDPYFNTHKRDVASYLIYHIQDYGGRYVAFRNHTKVICIANADRSSVVTIVGSANLSNQPQMEQFVLTTAPAVYDFFVNHLFNWALDVLDNR